MAGLTAAVAALLVAVAVGATVAAVQYRLVASEEERLRNEAEDRAEAEAKAKEELEASLYFHRIALAHRELLENNLLKAEELLDQCPARPPCLGMVLPQAPLPRRAGDRPRSVWMEPDGGLQPRRPAPRLGRRG